MKKKLLLGVIASLFISGGLISCGGGNTPTPEPEPEPEPILGDKIIVNYFIDYSNIDYDNPYFTNEAYQNGLVTKSSKTPTAEDAPDPAFPIFLGWSSHTLVDDVKDLWNFETDRVGEFVNYLGLYGIWVNESGETTNGVKHVYLHTGGSTLWSIKDNEGRSPKFAVWANDIGGVGKYAEMTLVEGQNAVYEVELDTYYSDIQFLRMNPSYVYAGGGFPVDNTETIPGIWNKTTIQYMNPENDYYKVTGWGESDGELNKWTGQETPEEEDDGSYGRVDKDPDASSEWYVVGTGLYLNGGATWSVAGGIRMSETKNPQFSVSEGYATIKFAKGDIWKITNNTTWVQMACLETSSPVISSGDMKTISDGYGGYNVEVCKTGTYTIYFKVLQNADPSGNSGYSIWLSEANVD